MCPACIAAAALVVAGAISTGGLTALAIKRQDTSEEHRPDKPNQRRAR